MVCLFPALIREHHEQQRRPACPTIRPSRAGKDAPARAATPGTSLIRSRGILSPRILPELISAPGIVPSASPYRTTWGAGMPAESTYMPSRSRWWWAGPGKHQRVVTTMLTSIRLKCPRCGAERTYMGSQLARIETSRRPVRIRCTTCSASIRIDRKK
jgi:hypothetical protein